MEDVRAKEPYPPFAASVKDGYAVIGKWFFPADTKRQNNGHLTSMTSIITLDEH